MYSFFENLYFSFEVKIPSNTQCIGVKLGHVPGTQMKKIRRKYISKLEKKVIHLLT
jgi:hypothetical protein